MVASLATDEVDRIAAKYSFFSSTSFLAEINQVADRGGAIDLDPESAALLEFGLACYGRSGGLFDITSGILKLAYDFSTHTIRQEVPLASLLARVGMNKLRWNPPTLEFPAFGMRLDFGGIAKEYAVDRVAAIFREHQIASALIDLGGDMVAVGPQPDGSAWEIGIRSPSAKTKVAAKVSLTKGAVTTSGDYENYIEIEGRRHSHVLNPISGLPTADIVSVTALAANCMAAGAATTIAMLHGDSAADWLRTQNIPFLAVTAEGKQINALPRGSYSAG